MSRRPAGEESGYTLVETMVVIALLTVVMGFVTETIITVQRAFSRSTSRLVDTGELRTAFDTLTKTMRTATRLDTTSAAFLPAQVTVSGSPVNNVIRGRQVVENGVECWFYANLENNPAPQLAHYFLDGSQQLIEEFTSADAFSVAPNWTYTGVPYRRRVVARRVVVPTAGGTPIFTYLSQGGVTLNVAGDVNAGIPDSSLSGIGDVLIRLAVRSGPTARSVDTTLVNRVRLVNADVPANSSSTP